MVRMAEFKIREELVMKTYFMSHSVLHRILGLAISVTGATILVTSVFADDGTVFTKTIFQDQFNREEAGANENPGNGWGTNSKSRAKGEKQVFLRDNAMYIKRAAVADHGVSVTQDVSFQDVKITTRFMLPQQGDLGVNIADMNEPSVHAGHICMARIKPASLEIVDLKTGRMRKEIHEKNKAKTLTKAEKKDISTKSKIVPLKLKTDVWHNLEIVIAGDTMSVKIDGRQIGRMTSAGIGHETKRRIRLAVNTEAWVDDFNVAAPQ